MSDSSVLRCQFSDHGNGVRFFTGFLKPKSSFTEILLEDLILDGPKFGGHLSQLNTSELERISLTGVRLMGRIPPTPFLKLKSFEVAWLGTGVTQHYCPNEEDVSNALSIIDFEPDKEKRQKIISDLCKSHSTQVTQGAASFRIALTKNADDKWIAQCIDCNDNSCIDNNECVAVE